MRSCPGVALYIYTDYNSDHRRLACGVKKYMLTACKVRQVVDRCFLLLLNRERLRVSSCGFKLQHFSVASAPGNPTLSDQVTEDQAEVDSRSRSQPDSNATGQNCGDNHQLIIASGRSASPLLEPISDTTDGKFSHPYLAASLHCLLLS